MHTKLIPLNIHPRIFGLPGMIDYHLIMSDNLVKEDECPTTHAIHQFTYLQSSILYTTLIIPISVCYCLYLHSAIMSYSIVEVLLTKIQ
jgi:hypothetical protein